MKHKVKMNIVYIIVLIVSVYLAFYIDYIASDNWFCDPSIITLGCIASLMFIGIISNIIDLY